MEITFKGSPVTLCGKQLCPGDRMPNFTLTDRRLQAVYGRELTGIRVFLTVPSLDTGVCDQEVRRFNETAASFPSAHIYAISMDLPFAQSRWCAQRVWNGYRRSPTIEITASASQPERGSRSWGCSPALCFSQAMTESSLMWNMCPR